MTVVLVVGWLVIEHRGGGNGLERMVSRICWRHGEANAVRTASVEG